MISPLSSKHRVFVTGTQCCVAALIERQSPDHNRSESESSLVRDRGGVEQLFQEQSSSPLHCDNLRVCCRCGD